MPFIINVPNTNYGIKHPEQIYDNIIISTYKWFSLSKNTLDGSFHPLDTTGQYQVGWWGDVLSDSAGVLPAQTITISGSRSIHKLQITGDKLLNEFPVDFVINLYAGTDKVYTVPVVGNNNYIWAQELEHVYDITNFEIIVTKINTPNTVLKLVDIFSPFEFKRQDTLQIAVEESSGINDSLSLIFTEDSNITVNVAKLDELLIGLDQTSKGVESSFNSNSILTLLLSESNSQIISITSPDDTLSVRLIEKSKVTNIHTIMDGNLRQTFGKVEITYAAPFLGDSVDILSTQVGRFTSVNNIADNVSMTEYKWASCHDNKLDGTYHPLPDVTSKKWHVGLWGTELSKVDGTFDINPVITLNFESRPIYYLKVSGDEKLQNFPVDFILTVYDKDDILIYTETVVGNIEPNWYKDLQPTINAVSKVVLTISKISQPLQVFKITEFFNSIVETYYNKEIVSMHLLEELDYVESSVTLGAVSSNEIDIVLDNSTGKFNIMDKNIPLYNLIKRNRKVRAWLGAEIIPDIVEWYPLGVFYSNKWNIPDRSLTATVTARDRLDLLNYSDFEASEVYINKTIADLYRIVLNDAGLEEQVDFIINSEACNTVIPYAWFDKMSHRDALQRVSGCLMIQLFCDRNGIINITDMIITDTLFYTFTDTRSVIKKDFPFVWNEITNYVEVVADVLKESTNKSILESKETITIPAGQTMTVNYTFNTSPIIRINPPTIVGNTSIGIQTYKLSCNGIEITLLNNTASDQSLNSINIDGIALEKQTSSVSVVKDEAQIRENGTLKFTLSHDFIQSSTYAHSLANDLLLGYKDSKYDVKLECRGNIGLYLGEKVAVEDYRLGTSEPYIIKRQAIDWDGSLRATVECKNLD